MMKYMWVKVIFKTNKRSVASNISLWGVVTWCNFVVVRSEIEGSLMNETKKPSINSV